jgi:hypothetical protein
MSDEHGEPIGLAELIEKVKSELLSGEISPGSSAPLFSVDQVELELQVTLKREGKAGIKIYVIEVDGSDGRDDVQKVKVTLSPLLDKAERLALIRDRHPDELERIRWAAIQGAVKGIGEPGASQFGR